MNNETEIQWHPGFCGAIELELRDNKDDLTFEREYNLSKMPLRIDMLVVEKRDGVVIKNEIGKIFKRFNILEYKSPQDTLNIDDFFKVFGYACLYKGLGEKTNDRPENEITVSIIRETYPRELMKALSERGFVIKKACKGIYYVEGNVLFTTQIVVLRQISKDLSHIWLRALSDKLDMECAMDFIKLAKDLITPGDKENADAIFEVSARANNRIYEEIRRNPVMCQALRELMKDDILEAEDKAEARGRAEGRSEGFTEGKNNMILIIKYLKAGKTESELLDMGYDMETILLAKSVL